MAGTRSKNDSSPHASNGTKRKADEQTSPTQSKRPSKDQKTIDESFKPADDADEGFDEDMNDKESEVKQNGKSEAQEQEEIEEANAGEDVEEPKQKKNEKSNEKNALDGVKANKKDEGKTSKDESHENGTANGDGEVKEKAIEEDKEREQAQPSNILEKGIIYFFARGRVGVEDPDSVQDLARSHFVLRPLPAGAKITDGAIQDVGNNRLVALPKKVFPKSGKDRFMAFIEKEKASMETLKEEFFSGSSYSTKTVGTRHTPEVTPIGEGVYAITTTGGGQGTTHLAYMLTIPNEVGEVQKDMGIAEKGSFVMSLKNPESSAPSYALPNNAEFPKEFIEEFGGRGWMPVQPKHLDYVNAAFLLIGENFESSNNLEPAPKDEKDDKKETPAEELEKLEEEDEHRVENLRGDDTVFADLGISSKEYPKVLTTW
ncbi:hypothetical protein CKM354_001169400 [Cercospora kikuchii]|uniref:BTB domain transcription factor n=1 Tax=Cercospora kikuchii TaxID=84275 RepID=A0A9P3CSR0_9PEZI|nr:uncharacterized protein CKM354_001169400 [Cercospora kikuchii]GIZ48642.1 hypothetical protein CKM354_001169400 [Cercospora kikuchii]